MMILIKKPYKNYIYNKKRQKTFIIKNKLANFAKI